MLRRVEELKNYVLIAEDGEIGRCKDFLFDDQWTIRYMVANTGKWLPGRKVLISPALLGKPKLSDGRFPVKATKEQIENSPPLRVTEPVTREYEAQWHDYYGWPYYWAGPCLLGACPRPASMYADPGTPRGYYVTTNPKARNLESASEVSGFHIQATDGVIGHINDFILDDDDWAIRYIIVDTRNWLPGKEVLLASGWFRDVRWAAKKVGVEMTRNSVKSSPEYVQENLNRDYEIQLHRHYGFPPYWEGPPR